MAAPRYAGMSMPAHQQQHDFNMHFQASHPHQLYQNGAMAQNNLYHPHIAQQQQQQQYAQLQFGSLSHTQPQMQSAHSTQYYQHQITAPTFHSNINQMTSQQLQQQQHARIADYDQNMHNPILMDSRAGPSAATAAQHRWGVMDEEAARMSAETDWLEEDESVDGAGSVHGGPGKDKDHFRCTHCDKIYKGKHARSIWRRHLQDKHGIPLSHQPRRTRWDADANRPKNAEERRERMLESKRRWARKKRAMDKSDSKGKGEEGATPESSASPASVDVPEPVKIESPAKPVKKSTKAIMSSLRAGGEAGGRARAATPPSASGEKIRHLVPSQSETFARPTDAAPTDNRYAWSFGRRTTAVPASAPFTATLGSTFAAPASVLPSPGGTPDRRRTGRHHASHSMQFSPTSIVPTASGSQIPLTTPSRLGAANHAAHSLSRSISTGSVGTHPNPFSLEHHKISPVASARPLSQARKARESVSSHARILSLGGGLQSDLLMSPTRPPSTSRHGSLRDAFPSLLDTPNKHTMEDALLLGSAAAISGKMTTTAMSHSQLGESAMKDDPRPAEGSVTIRHRRRSSRLNALRGSSDDEGKLPSAALTTVAADRPRRLRKPTSGDSAFDDSGLCLTGMTPFHKSIGRQVNGVSGLGATPATHSLMDSSFPQTVGRPSPFKRGHRKGTGSSADSLDLDVYPLGHRDRDTFSSPHHSSLAHSLGLAPQSALRTGSVSNGEAAGASTFDFVGLGTSPFHHSSMSGMSLGFTPWEKGNSMASRRDSVGISWPESIRKPLTGALKFAHPRRSSSVPALDQDDDGDNDDDEEEEDQASTAKGSARGKENLASSASKSGRYHHARAEDTPSRPSGKVRKGVGGGVGSSGIKRKHDVDEADEDEDEDEGLMPLRFSAAGNKKLNTGRRTDCVETF